MIRPRLDLFAIDPLRFFPELIPAGAHLIPNKIQCNPDQPRVNAALSSKGPAAFVSVPETVLRQ